MRITRINFNQLSKHMNGNFVQNPHYYLGYACPFLSLSDKTDFDQSSSQQTNQLESNFFRWFYGPKGTTYRNLFWYHLQKMQKTKRLNVIDPMRTNFFEVVSPCSLKEIKPSSFWESGEKKDCIHLRPFHSQWDPFYLVQLQRTTFLSCEKSELFFSCLRGCERWAYTKAKYNNLKVKSTALNLPYIFHSIICA